MSELEADEPEQDAITSLGLTDAQLLLKHFDGQLAMLSKELTCPICMDLIDQAHSLPCNHFFCLACIQEALKHKSECPMCKQPTIPRSLQPFRLLANLVHWYRQNNAVFKGLSAPSPQTLTYTSADVRPAKRPRSTSSSASSSSSSTESPSSASTTSSPSQSQGSRSISMLLENLELPPLPSSVVVVGSGLDDRQSDKLHDLSKFCKVESEVTAATTHLVTSATGYPTARPAKRTLKYFEGILRGVWVVSSDWAEHSLLAGQLLAEDVYVVMSNNRQEDAPAPKIVRELRREGRFEPLFAGHEFFVRQASDFPSDEIRQLVTIGGGKLAKSERRRAGAGHLWIIYDEVTDPSPSTALDSGHSFLTKETFFKAIVNYRFPPAEQAPSLCF